MLVFRLLIQYYTACWPWQTHGHGPHLAFRYVSVFHCLARCFLKKTGIQRPSLLATVPTSS